MPEPVGLLLVGPDEHGVVRFGRHLAAALPGRPTATVPSWSGDLSDLAPLAGCTLVHAQVTDRLFGVRCEDAADALVGLAGRLHTQGIGLSVTLHDLPAGVGDLDRRRSNAYRRIVEVCRGVVVCSEHERDLLARVTGSASDTLGPALAVVPLPIDPPALRRACPRPGGDAAVLGFLYPDKGHDEVLRALPPGLALTAIGRAADGHEDVVRELSDLARASGHRLTVTGFVPDGRLTPMLRAVGVPIAPHRRVSASGSIGTWLGAGRRPLVPDIAYTREIDGRCPGALAIYTDLAVAIADAVADPARTWLGDTAVGPSTTDVAAAYARTWAGWA